MMRTRRSESGARIWIETRPMSGRSIARNMQDKRGRANVRNTAQAKKNQVASVTILPHRNREAAKPSKVSLLQKSASAQP